jgi:hypothetical protein
LTEDDTYKKLKRKVDYNEACAIYTIVCMDYASETHRDILIAAAEPELNKVGWTMDELLEEDTIRRAEQQKYESKYG